MFSGHSAASLELRDAPRVLLISPFFPPRRRVGSLRAYRFARELPDFGWVPVVAHLANRDEDADNEERSLLDRIARCPIGPSPGPARAKLGGADGEFGQATPSRFAPWQRAIDRRFPVDTWTPVLLSAVPKILRFARKHQIQAVWSTADPWSSHLLASTIARALKIPWIADFRDPWTLCERRGQDRPQWTRFLDRQAEKTILRRAQAITFTAEATRRKYCDAFPTWSGKMHTLYNSYDAAASTPPAEQPSIATSTDCVEVLFFGRFRELSPASSIIAVLRSLRELSPLHYARCRIASMGPLPEPDALEAQRQGVFDRFVVTKSVNYADAHPRLAQADILLLSTAVERDDIIPAKLWDYLPAGRPILSLSPNVEVGDVLRDCELGRNIEPRGENWPREAAQQLCTLIDASSSGSRVGRPDRIAHYASHRVSEKLAQLLEVLTERRPVLHRELA